MYHFFTYPLERLSPNLIVFFLIVQDQFLTSCQGFQIEPIHVINVQDLSRDSLEDFDNYYLNRKPIILSGTTVCPVGLDFHHIRQYCVDANIPGNYIHRKSQSENKWAGLKPGDRYDHVNFYDWVDAVMKRKRNYDRHDGPEFLFDAPMAELCPELMRDVMIPGHLMGVFASQYKYRNTNPVKQEKNQADMEHIPIGDICTDMPFYNMYLAQESFQTDLHIDAGHSSFVASMCVGKKRWRVMTNHDFAVSFEHIGADGGKLVNGTLVLGSLPSPFNTWDDDADDFILNSLNVTIYEGILEPGQLLYIPAGAPHAATTLNNSIMLASNDHSLQNLREAVEYCNIVNDDHVACHGFRVKLRSMESGLEGMSLKRVDMSLPESTGCEKTYDLLANVKLDNVVSVTPDNFRQLIEDGPLVILKSQKNCGSCLFLLNVWNSITQGFDPPLRFAILHCFQGQCPHTRNEDELYQQLVEAMEDKPSPHFHFVKLNGAGQLSLVEYVGLFSIDFIRVWASVMSGSFVPIKPLWWKISLQTFYCLLTLLAFIVETFGPIGIFFVVLTVMIMCIQIHSVLDSFSATSWLKLLRKPLPKRKRA